MPPPSPWSHTRNASVADDIDFDIKGQELQFVEIELDPGESAIAEAGAMVWKDASVGMTTVFGDGSETDSGIAGKLLGAGKRLLTGESLFMTVFTHNGRGKARVAFAAPTPGSIIPLRLAEYGGRIICQKDSFLAAAKGVSVGIHFQKRILTGLFGGEGFIMQKLEGDGWVFAQMGGAVIERTLGAGEELHVDTGCIAAFTAGVDLKELETAPLTTSRACADRERSGFSPCPSRASPAECWPLAAAAVAQTAAKARCLAPSATSSAAADNTRYVGES